MKDYTSPQGYKGLAGFHKYWGKKPIESWRFLIDHFTDESDVVLDPFLGSGLIARECVDQKRRFVGFDINPISIELTRMFVDLPNYSELRVAFERLIESVHRQIDSFYTLSDGRIVSHLLWDGKKLSRAWVTTSNKRFEIVMTNQVVERFRCTDDYRPTKIRNIQLFDNSRINSKSSLTLDDLFTSRALRTIDILKQEIEKHEERIRRALTLALSASMGQMSKMVFAVSRRGKSKGEIKQRIEVGSWVIGYWRPDLHFEVNALNCFANKGRKLLKAIKFMNRVNTTSLAANIDEFNTNEFDTYIAVGDSENLLHQIQKESIKVVLTDPPHGDRIPYLELSEIWNSVLGLDVNYEKELVVSNAKDRGKGISQYNKKLSTIFKQCARVLCRGGLLAVMFNARSRDYWSSLHELESSTSLTYLGCYPMEYSARSVVQDNRRGSLKTDFVLLFGKDLRSFEAESFQEKIPGWSYKKPNEV